MGGRDGREHQAAGGSLRVSRRARRHRACIWAASELGLRHWPPFVCDVLPFTNQVLAQLDLLKNWKETKQYKNDVYLLPKALDEKVAALHLPALGAEMAIMTQAQADYIGVPVAGPFKGPAYRY